VSTSGQADSSEVNGNVTAQLRGLASKLADLGVSGTGRISSEQYQNVLRSDLAATLKDNAACKLKVFETLQTKFLSSESSPPLNITGRWRDVSDPTSVAQVTQNGDQTEITKKGTLTTGVQYELSGSCTLWSNTFTCRYNAKYDNGASSTGFCQGASPREGYLTSNCRDTMLGIYSSAMVHE
jgi:hypothetical protein